MALALVFGCSDVLLGIDSTDGAGNGVGAEGQDEGIEGICGIDQAGEQGAEDAAEGVHRLVEAHGHIAVFLGSPQPGTKPE